MTTIENARQVNGVEIDSNLIVMVIDGNLIELKVELITPEIAEYYLTKNVENRNLRPSVAAAYSDDMACGVWAFNGDPLRFDENGKLVDGQHRLRGIVKSGVAIYMLVIRGLKSSQQHTIDTGARRSFADVLKLRGELNYITLAAMTRAVRQWVDTEQVSKSSQFTNSQLLNTLEQYPWIREGCSVLNLTNSKTGLPVSATAGPWFAFTQLNAEDTEHFFSKLCSDQNHSEGEPIYTLRKLALASRDDIKGSRNIGYLSAVMVLAWNKFREGEECKLLRWTRGGANPQKFPVPK
jgi:hypothetical protein